jgi:ABC-type antimicrobial peptide transport system permease subunit
LQRGGWAGDVIALICRVGQQSLAVFAASMVMARGLGAVLHFAGNGPVAALLVNLAGFALVIGVAQVTAWFKSQPWKTAVMRPAVQDTSPAMRAEVRP